MQRLLQDESKQPAATDWASRKQGLDGDERGCVPMCEGKEERGGEEGRRWKLKSREGSPAPRERFCKPKTQIGTDAHRAYPHCFQADI